MDNSIFENFMFEKDMAPAFTSLTAWKRIVCETRVMLDSSDRKYFDSYLVSLLSSISDTLSSDIADQGFNSFKEVRDICKHIIDNDPYVDTQHPFYAEIKHFVEQHNCQDRQAIIEACCLYIFVDFTQYALNTFKKNHAEKLKAAIEMYNLETKREKIVALLSEEKIREIEILAKNFFRMNSPVGSFLLGMVESIIMSAQYQDKVTGQYIFDML